MPAPAHPSHLYCLQVADADPNADKALYKITVHTSGQAWARGHYVGCMRCAAFWATCSELLHSTPCVALATSANPSLHSATPVPIHLPHPGIHADIKFAGTDANVRIQLFGEK